MVDERRLPTEEPRGRRASSAQAFVIERNSDLNDIPATAFSSLKRVGNFQLTDLAGLAALPAGAFPALEAVGPNPVAPSDFWLGYNPALRLVEPGAFPSLKRVEGDVWLLFSAALESVAGALPALAEVRGRAASDRPGWLVLARDAFSRPPLAACRGIIVERGRP